MTIQPMFCVPVLFGCHGVEPAALSELPRHDVPPWQARITPGMTSRERYEAVFEAQARWFQECAEAREKARQIMAALALPLAALLEAQMQRAIERECAVWRLWDQRRRTNKGEPSC